MTECDEDCSAGGRKAKSVVAASMKNVVGGSNSSTHTASGESAQHGQFRHVAMVLLLMILEHRVKLK